MTSLFWSNIRKHLQLNNERRSTIIVVEVKGEACVGHHNKKGDARQDPSLWGKNITFGSAAYSIASIGQLWWRLSLDRWRRLSVDGLTGVGARDAYTSQNITCHFKAPEQEPFPAAWQGPCSSNRLLCLAGFNNTRSLGLGLLCMNTI